MMNNFDFNNFIKSEVQRQVDERVKELQPKIIVKEKETKVENLENSFRCYTVPHVAKEFFHCDVNTVWKLIKKGELNGIKIKSMKISAMEIKRFLDENAGRDFDEILND